jgi:hypothetical protein
MRRVIAVTQVSILSSQVVVRELSPKAQLGEFELLGYGMSKVRLKVLELYNLLYQLGLKLLDNKPRREATRTIRSGKRLVV